MNLPIPAAQLTARLKATAAELGFALAGACPAVSPAGFPRLAAWLEAGFAGEMSYFGDRLEAYQHPRHVLDEARGLLLLGLPYHTAAPAPGGKEWGGYPGTPGDERTIMT